MQATLFGSLILALALGGQYFVGHAQHKDDATGLTGWQVRWIRATPAWVYVATWLLGTAFIAWRHNPSF